MNDTERWLRRQAAREQRGMVLEEALLGGRPWRYARYRLRYFFAKYLVETAVHAVTVGFLVLELDWGAFLPIVVAHVGTMLASNLWWGALEGLRARVRDLHRSGRPHRIARTIGGWLAFSGLLSVGVLALAVGWLIWHGASGTFGAPTAYVAALLLRLAVDLPLRCYHSGVYALRRVYRPLPAVLGPELLELATIVLLAPFIGLWSLVVASLILTVTLTAVTLHYTGRVYHFIGLAPRGEVNLRAMRSSLRGTGRESLMAGAANACIALDSLVVLALLYGVAPDSQALVVLFLVAPSIRAGADWARLFYFDLKRLELRLFTNLRQRFERHTARLAGLLGVAFWAVAAGITAVFYRRVMLVPSLALLGFFVARSLLARVQVQVFSEGAYAPVVGTALLLLAGVGLSSRLPGGEGVVLAAVALVTAASAAGLGRLRSRSLERGEPGAALLTLEWLHRLARVNEPVRIGSARVLVPGGPNRLDGSSREEQARWRLAQLAERVARELRERGAAAWVGPDRLVWFEPAGGPRVIVPRWLELASGGLVADVVDRDCANGEEALLAAGQQGLLGPASAHLLTAVVPVDVGAARRRFAELVPEGVVFSPDQPVPPAFAALPGPELRAILVDAVAFARDLRLIRRRARFDVSALCAGGELRLIFVAPPRGDKRVRSGWRRHVARMNVRAAVGGARVAQRGRGRVARRGAPAVTQPPAASRRPGALRRARPAVDPARVEALRRVPLLSELRPDELARVAAAMTDRTFAAGEQVTREGEAGVGFFVIEEGEAIVTVGGRQVGVLRPGDHFGELALIAETPRLATVTALTSLRCHRMASWEFRTLVEGNASISWHVLQATAKLLQEAHRDALASGSQPPSGDVEPLAREATPLG